MSRGLRKSFTRGDRCPVSLLEAPGDSYFVRALVGRRQGSGLVAGAGSTMAMVFAISQPKPAPDELRTILLLAMTAILFSILPNLWAYAASYAVADSLLSIFIFGLFGFWATGVVLIDVRRCRAISPVRTRRDSDVE
jgi:hypothetical protein